MALNRKIRLPELAIFRKYSLALRQEFARPEEILQVLDESRRQIRALSGGEESRSDRPELSHPRPARLRAPQRSRQAPREENPAEDESPRSFLKESLVDAPGGRPSVERAGSAATQATVAMPALDPAAAQNEAAGPNRSSKKAAGSGRPAKKTTGRKGSRVKASASEEGSATTDARPSPVAGGGSGVTPLKSESTPATSKRQAPGRQKRRRTQDEDSATDEERQFWGEDRSSAKGRRARDGAGKQISPEVQIVRTGADGRPVARESGLANEGDD